MDKREFLKNWKNKALEFEVRNNYRIGIYPKDLIDLLNDFEKQLHIPVDVKSFICDAEEKGGSKCETQCLGCDGFQRNE